MTKMYQKFVAALLFMVGGACIVAVPSVREALWKDTKATTRIGGPVSEEEKEREAEIERLALIDDSIYDRIQDIRYIRKLPSDPILVEAAHRQRRTDAAEVLPAGEPVFLTGFTLALTARDKMRREPLPATRRPVLSVGLSMLDIDKQALPILARSAILDFIDNHYVDIQARIIRDTITEKWILHHRPIAMMGKYRNLPMTQEFQDAVAKTVNDMRGIGVLRPDGINADTPTQTAVWIFRSDWLLPGTSFGMPRFEYVFVHAVPDNPEDPKTFQVHTIVTTDQRTVFHKLSTRTTSVQPDRPGKVDVLATVAFTGYASDGLHPTTSASRDVRIGGSSHYLMTDLEQFLASKELEGGISKNMISILNGMVDGSLPPSSVPVPSSPGFISPGIEQATPLNQN